MDNLRNYSQKSFMQIVALPASRSFPVGCSSLLGGTLMVKSQHRKWNRLLEKNLT